MKAQALRSIHPTRLAGQDREKGPEAVSIPDVRIAAGLTDSCGMAMLLARMPWNK